MLAGESMKVAGQCAFTITIIACYDANAFITYHQHRHMTAEGARCHAPGFENQTKSHTPWISNWVVHKTTIGIRFYCVILAFIEITSGIPGEKKGASSCDVKLSFFGRAPRDVSSGTMNLSNVSRPIAAKRWKLNQQEAQSLWMCTEATSEDLFIYKEKKIPCNNTYFREFKRNGRPRIW